MMYKSQRIDKYLANMGICARRAVEKLLNDKDVTVNGKRILLPGIRIEPTTDEVKIDGKLLRKPELTYFLLNKPKGYITTTSDDSGRRDVMSLIHEKERLYPVGRLDMNTTGLLILTNDGELTHFLTHPKHHINKVYKLTVEGKVEEKALSKLKNGVELEDGITSPAEVQIKQEKNDNTIIEMTVHEGRNRQIRRMCKAVGINLIELDRIAIGTISDNSLKTGQYRKLTHEEITSLKPRG